MTLTIVEIVLVVVVLVYYLLRIAASLRRTSALLGKVSFGVRAIETQTEVIGPAVTTVNGQLRTIGDALSDLTGLAAAAAAAGLSSKAPPAAGGP